MQIKILTSNSTLPVLDALIPVYEKSSGYTVAVSADSAKAMVARIRGGESGDVLVLGNGAVKELTEAGFINGATRRGFARAIVGVGVIHDVGEEVFGLFASASPVAPRLQVLAAHDVGTADDCALHSQ